MGILDSNISRITDLKEKGTIAENITSAMNGSASTYNVDCSKYNTCTIIVYNANSTTIPFRIFLKRSSLESYSGNILVGDIFHDTNVEAKNVIAHNNGTFRFLVDVSNASYISIGKEESEDISFYYELSNGNGASNFILAHKTTYVPITPTINMHRLYCNYANTTIVHITNEDSFSIVLGAETEGTSFYKWFCKELGMFITANTVIPAGTYTFFADTHDLEEIYFRINSFSGTAGFALSDEPYAYNSFPYRLSYYLNRTSAIGAGNWLKIPAGTKYAIATIINNNANGTVGIFRGYKTPTMLETTPASSEAVSVCYNKAVNVDTKILVNTNSFTEKVTNLLFDVDQFGFVAASFNGTDIDLTIFFTFYNSEIPELYRNLLYPSSKDTLVAAGFTKVWGTESADLYRWENSTIPDLRCVMDNIWVWSSATKLFISLTGIAGEKNEVEFNSTNFPNLLANSSMDRVILLPYTRNATSSYHGRNWRLNVITSRGQVYHNFPSRSTSETSEGTSLIGDEYRFDESVIWELPERWTPVKTNIGSDATLIATGKYRYFPGLPDQCYEMHPAINQDNGYGNNGFGATLTKENITFGRFYNLDNTIPQCNAMSFMGGFAWHEKMCMIGTYMSNTGDSGTRICVFLTNDGGRQWFCRYEFGTNGRRWGKDENGDYILLKDTIGEGTWRHNIVFNAQSPTSGAFQVRSRIQVLPTAYEKEPSTKWAYGELIDVASIVCDGEKTIVTTTTNHGFGWGETIYFDKVGNSASDWDWIANSGYDNNSAGDGVVFKAKTIDNTSFYLMDCPHNPFNNIGARHIHSVDRCKDGYTVSSGERYPDGGWILWLPCVEGDAFDGKYPWGEDIELIRLNSTSTSMYRTLGTFILNDKDATVIAGLDDSMINVGSSALPEGRTESIRRSSQGVWKGKLADIDNLASFKNVLPTPDVAYGFKVLNGICVYIGQDWQVGVSFDYGDTWTLGEIPRAYQGEHCHFTGVSSERYIVVDNLLIKPKI